MIHKYESFLGNIFKKSPDVDSIVKDRSSAHEKITNFFTLSASDVKYILCDITDDIKVESGEMLKGGDSSIETALGNFDIVIRDDKFIPTNGYDYVINSDRKINVMNFISNLFEENPVSPKFTFNIEFSKSYSAKEGLLNFKGGTLSEEEMDIINDAGERVKEFCGFSEYRLVNRGYPPEIAVGMIKGFPQWRMRFWF